MKKFDLVVDLYFAHQLAGSTQDRSSSVLVLIALAQRLFLTKSAYINQSDFLYILYTYTNHTYIYIETYSMPMANLECGASDIGTLAVQVPGYTRILRCWRRKVY